MTILNDRNIRWALLRGMPRKFYFYLLMLLQSRVVLAQYLQYFGTAEFRGHFGAFGEHLAQLGAGEQQAVCVAVRTGACRGHAAALVAPEGPVDLERLGFQGIPGYLVEDVHLVPLAQAQHTRGVARRIGRQVERAAGRQW